jgi:hypothetical protein
MSSPFMMEMIDCECGVSIRRKNIKTHTNTGQHQMWEKGPENFNVEIRCACGYMYKPADRLTHTKTDIHRQGMKALLKTRAQLKARQTINCGCGSVYSMTRRSVHEKSMKHNEWTSSQAN